MIIFIFIWSTLVYNVVASWTWNVSGWSAKLGAIDYAGGVKYSLYKQTKKQILTFFYIFRLLCILPVDLLV